MADAQIGPAIDVDDALLALDASTQPRHTQVPDDCARPSANSQRRQDAAVDHRADQEQGLQQAATSLGDPDEAAKTPSQLQVQPGPEHLLPGSIETTFSAEPGSAVHSIHLHADVSNATGPPSSRTGHRATGAVRHQLQHHNRDDEDDLRCLRRPVTYFLLAVGSMLLGGMFLIIGFSEHSQAAHSKEEYEECRNSMRRAVTIIAPTIGTRVPCSFFLPASRPLSALVCAAMAFSSVSTMAIASDRSDQPEMPSPWHRTENV